MLYYVVGKHTTHEKNGTKGAAPDKLDYYQELKTQILFDSTEWADSPSSFNCALAILFVSLWLLASTSMNLHDFTTNQCSL
jgi:hypothetical protein